MKTVLISGGSRGIGRAAAIAAAAAGWNVAFTYRNDDAAAAETLGAIKAHGVEAIALKGDVTNEADVLSAYTQTLATFGTIHAVVVNAGIVGPTARLVDMTVERMQKIVDTNVIGALLFAREAARHLPEQQNASIVLISSAAARLGSPNLYVDYAASKGAIDTLTKGLAHELAPQGIRVNAIRPGLIETDIHASGGEPDRAAILGKTVPMGRAGTANEIADAIVWLISDQATYVTGTHIDVSGGR